MANLINIDFAGSDMAASTGGAALPLSPAPDATDCLSVIFPFPVEIRGILGAANPSSGDTVNFVPTVGGTAQTVPTLTIAHSASPTPTSVFMGSNQGIKVAAFTAIGVQYKTTTGTTYTANDLNAKLVIAVADGVL